MTANQVLDRYGVVVARFNSTRTPDKAYEVRMKDGTHTCNCPGWRFRRTCRHIEYVKVNRVREPQDDTVPSTFARFVVEDLLKTARVVLPVTKVLSMATALEPYLVRQPEPAAAAPRRTGVIRLITLED